MTWKRLSDEECERVVRETLDSLPEEFAERLRDVAVVVQDRHPEGLMGVYDPRGGLKRIVVFREANPNEEELRKTVLHEVGHFFGMDHDRLGKLGY
jgi:predicted Zn-dependent protease with MMP-like domain